MKQSKTALTNMWVFYFMWETTGVGFFSLEEALLWIMNSYFSQKQWFNVQMPKWWICVLQTCSFSLHKTIIDGLEWCGLLVDYCDVFISCLDSHSDGTHSLQSIHCWASGIMIHFSKSFKWRNKLIYISDVNVHIFIFRWTIPLCGEP